MFCYSVALLAAAMAGVLALPLVLASSDRRTAGAWPVAVAAAVPVGADSPVQVHGGGDDGREAAGLALGVLGLSLAALALASKRLGSVCWARYVHTGGRSRGGVTAGDFWHWG